MVNKNQHIKLVVKATYNDTATTTSVYFERPTGFVFDAGDWIDIEFEDQMLSGGKTYSMSSSPTERDIRITFRNGVSQRKRALQSLRPGDAVFISQYGNDYDFRMNKHRTSTLIAGGVGIAPFRSMLRERSDLHHGNEVRLIYLNQDNEILFKPELEKWNSESSTLTINYIQTKALNRKKRNALLLSLIKDPNRHFYIAGLPAMVESTEHLLIDNGVNIRDIRIDSFGGY